MNIFAKGWIAHGLKNPSSRFGEQRPPAPQYLHLNDLEYNPLIFILILALFSRFDL